MFILSHIDMFEEARKVSFQLDTKCESRGIVLSFSGAKVLVFTFLYGVLRRLLNFLPTNQDHLNTAKVAVKKTWPIVDSPDPQSIVATNWGRPLKDLCWRKQLQHINGDDLTEFGKRLFSEGTLSVHHEGWITDEEAINLKDELVSIFSEMKPHEEYKALEAQVTGPFPEQGHCLFIIPDPEREITSVYLQTGSSRDPKVMAFTMLLGKIIETLLSIKNPELFRWGNRLFITHMKRSNSIGIELNIVGDTSAVELNRKTRRFIGELSRCVQEVSLRDFDHYKQIVYYEIESNEIDPFDLWKAVELDKETLDYLKGASKQDLIEFIAQAILSWSSQKVQDNGPHVLSWVRRTGRNYKPFKLERVLRR